MSSRNEKVQQATDILNACRRKDGFWAAKHRYNSQFWTRDSMLAIMPLILANQEFDLVHRYLKRLGEQQRENGQIPILFLENTFVFLKEKIWRSIRSGKMSFMLKRWFTGNLWNLTPGTRDSEILYIIGMYQYAKTSCDWAFLVQNETRINKAFEYIENNLMSDGLVIGCDWRDTMQNQLGDKTLLTNNCLLHLAYTLANRINEANWLKARINETLWDGNHYLDYKGSDRFDPLGGALAILCRVAPLERYQSLIESFASVDSEYGVTIKCRHNPLNREEAEVIERTDGEVVWPFVVGFTALALQSISHSMGREQFGKMLKHDGFSEWYDPATGRGYGAGEQLWSATLFLRANAVIK